MIGAQLDEARQRRRRWPRQLLLGIGILLSVSLAVVYLGTFLQAHFDVPACSRYLEHDDSIQQAGNASMRWNPPAVRCSYPRDDTYGASAYQETHFALFGVVMMGALAVVLLYLAALALAP